MLESLLHRSLRLLLIATVALVLVTGASCETGQNPTSLWINYSQREIDLQLVDFEPPPF